MEQELLQEIASYWGTRAEGYSEVNEKELAGSQREAWLHVLEEQFPEKKKEEMKILDIGTGPGFFPMILSEAGYTVTAVDYTEEMLEKAKENLGKYTKYGLERVTLQRMDAQNLEFADETFDVGIPFHLLIDFSVCPTGFHTAALVQHNCFAAFARTKNSLLRTLVYYSVCPCKSQGGNSQKIAYLRGFCGFPPLMHYCAKVFFLPIIISPDYFLTFSVFR